MSNDTVQDWSAILDDDEYTWDAFDLSPDQVDTVLRSAGYDPVAVGKQMKLVADLALARRRAEMELEAQRRMAVIAYGAMAFCGALMGAVGMRLLTWLWGG